jgi:hypothetical protein
MIEHDRSVAKKKRSRQCSNARKRPRLRRSGLVAKQ